MITERRVFVLVTALLCLPLWVLPYFPSQDGPSHLYNARVLLDMLTNPPSVYNAWYQFTPWLTTNLTGTVLLTLLTAVFPPAIAEKVIFSLCIVLLAAGVRYAAGCVSANGSFLSFLVFPIAISFFFNYGFHSFTLSVALFCFTVGFWFRRWGAFHTRETLAFSALLVALFLSHVVPYVVACVTIGVPAVWITLRRGGIFRYFVPTALASLPSLLLFATYIAAALTHPSTATLPAAKANRLVGDNPMVAFQPVEAYILLCIALVMAALGLLGLYRRLRNPHITPFDLLLPTTVLVIGTPVLLPPLVFGGGFFRSRFLLLATLLALFWLSSCSFSRKERWAVVVTGILFTGLMMASLWRSYNEVNVYLGEVVLARGVIAPTATVLNLRYSHYRPQKDGRPISYRLDSFVHAGARLAHVPGGVWINNYEAASGHFLLSSRPGLDFPRVGLEEEPPCVELLSWQEKTHRGIDYVALTGYPESGSGETGCAAATFRELERQYDLIYRSRSRFVAVYKHR